MTPETLPRRPPRFAVGDRVVLSPADARVKQVLEAKWVNQKEAWVYWCRDVDDPEATHFTYPERVLMRYVSPTAG